MPELLKNIAVILVKPEYPENIGMAARACANMGCPSLILVDPLRQDMEKTRKTATRQGECVLENMKIVKTLAQAITGQDYLYAATARLGGWRRAWLTPENAACSIMRNPCQKTGILFGPEDRGLNNDEIAYAENLVHIPTASAATSLNLAQSILIILHELRKAAEKNAPQAARGEKGINLEEQLRLEENFKAVLIDLDCLHGQNPEYFFIQWRQILRKARLKRHEYDAFMGLCRQIRRKLR